MARITYVDHAQQRYARVPVIDPTTGKQKRTPKMRDGVQMKSRHNLPIFAKITKADKTKPLPMPVCEKCRTTIEVGQPYKHVSPKSGVYGGRTRTRCASCPTWQPWDLSDSLSARTAQISHEGRAAIEGAETQEEVEGELEGIAEMIRELAEEKRESASNIENGFGHETEQSQELADIADQLDSWADDVVACVIPETPEPEEDDCEACGGHGTVTSEEDEDTTEECEDCSGNGQMTPDEPTEDQMNDWRQEVEDATSIIDECPI